LLASRDEIKVKKSDRANKIGESGVSGTFEGGKIYTQKNAITVTGERSREQKKPRSPWYASHSRDLN